MQIANDALEVTGVVDRLLRTLKCVAETGDFKARDIAQKAGIPTSTVYRFLQTMAAANFIEKSHHGSYTAGRELVRLTFLVVDHFDYEAIADPALRMLADRFHETSAFAIYLPGEHAFTIVHKIDSLHPLQHVVSKHRPRPMVWGALGRAMLPFLSKEDILAAIENQGEALELDMPPMTYEVLAAEFESIHRQGCFAGTRPSALGTNGTAAPVFNSRGQLIGSVGITIPSVRYDASLQSEINAAVIEAASAISIAFGYDEDIGRNRKALR